jgi:hypothetical protein
LIWQAEMQAVAERAFDLFIETCEPKYPKATLCLQNDREELLAFFDFPAQALAGHANDEFHRVDPCHRSPLNQAIQRLHDTGRNVAHDVQTGTVRSEELGTIVRIRWSGQGDHWTEMQR